MELDEICKYLGIEESYSIDNCQMIDKLVKEYYCQVQKILNTESILKYKITAINNLAVSVLVYGFRTINWLRKEIEKIFRKTRKFPAIDRIHHPKADVNRPYVKNEMVGMD
jgi:hypothetical protein